MFARASEKRQQRDLTMLVLISHRNRLVTLMKQSGLRVTLTRIAPSNGLDPDDNLRSALKWVKDGVAKTLGVDDRDPVIKWDYDQKRGSEYAVHVRIEAKETKQ